MMTTMQQDTKMGGSGDRFPKTRRSVIAQASSKNARERQRAWNTIVSIYWKPVYKYLRTRFKKSSEDAKDLTQGFFAQAIGKNFFKGFKPGKAKFRTFLRTCVDGFVSNEGKTQRALKRGGSRKVLSLDFTAAEEELSRRPLKSATSHADYFHKEWVRSLLGAVIDELQAHYEKTHKVLTFELFRHHGLARNRPKGPPSYHELAAEWGLDVTAVTNRLAAVRRDFRKAVLDKLRELTSNVEEFEEEVQALLGIKLP
jgi:RNA polymerase sigma factor (sigma-70 family)